MVSIGILAFAIALAGMSIASYTDIIKREVPNRISFGLIFAMIILRAVYAIQQNKLNLLWISLLIGAIFFAIGLVFFYTGQWGGADLKLLTAIGIGFATIYTEFKPLFPVSWPFAITILMNFFLVAVVYSIFYSLMVGISNKKVLSDFKTSLSNKYEVLSIAALIFVITVFGAYFKFPLILWLLSVPVFYVLIKFLKAVEINCMYKKTTADKLVEFDIPEKDLIVNKKVLVNTKDPNGMSLEQVAKIRKLVEAGKLRDSFKIKWGIPLVPVFPITLIVTLYIGDIYFTIIRYLVFGSL